MAQSQALLVAIQALHAAIAEHPDPAAKATLTTCLANMLKVQQADMQQAQQPQAAVQQAVGARLGGQ